MTESTCIPVVIGVTGHRQIRREDEGELRAAVVSELKKLQALCPHSPFLMLSSLAEGGDLLCADAAEELGIEMAVVLPREMADYEQDFSELGRKCFEHHCGRAGQVFTAPRSEAVPEGGEKRNDRFRQAGIYVAGHCHVLIALWDGETGHSGCGTAETVDFALNGNFAPASGISPRSGSNTAVIHVFTPRGGKTGDAAGNVQILGSWDTVREILCRTDDFNRNAASMPLTGNSRLPAEAEEEPALRKMEAVSRIAGTLSRQAAGRYRRVLALLAAASSALTFAFLLYDEAQAIWMILVCGLMLAAAWACQRYAVRSDCHRRYIEYRVLAECLRVQTYLRYAGSSVRAADLLSWTQQEETAWVLDALCALTIARESQSEHDIRLCWVEAQREYHQNAAQSAGHKLAVSDRTVRFALTLSVGLYLLGVGYELLCGGLIFHPAIRVADVELWRTALKILMGTISAVTLFTANYYGRLSLPRTLSDHQKMERFYAKMSSQLEKRGQTDKLLEVLAREELTENGNWCSYQRDNKPDIAI